VAERRTMPASCIDPNAWDDLIDLDENGEDLTSWEANFVDSLMKQLRAGHRCSDLQRSTLERIREQRLP